jgi:hypothetical protein
MTAKINISHQLQAFERDYGDPSGVLAFVQTPSEAKQKCSEMLFKHGKISDLFNRLSSQTQQDPQKARKITEMKQSLDRVKSAFEAAVTQRISASPPRSVSRTETRRSETQPLTAESFIRFYSTTQALESIRSTAEAEGLHRNMLQERERVLAPLPRNPTEAQACVYSGLCEKLQNTVQRFTNALLTRFPTAKIVYNPCGDHNVTCIHRTTPLAADNSLKTQTFLVSERLILGDGNCFYYSFLARYLEVALQQGTLPQLQKQIETDSELSTELQSQLLNSLRSVRDPNSLERVLQDTHQVLPFVYYLRLLTARTLPTDADLLMALRLREEDESQNEQESDDALIHKKVLTMGTWATQPTIIALCRALDFPIAIVSKKKQFPFVDSKSIPSSASSPQALLFFTGNHYSVLYETERDPVPVSRLSPPSSQTPPSAAPVLLPSPFPRVSQLPPSSTTTPPATAPAGPPPPPQSSRLVRVLRFFFFPLIWVWKKLFG